MGHSENNKQPLTIVIEVGPSLFWCDVPYTTLLAFVETPRVRSEGTQASLLWCWGAESEGVFQDHCTLSPWLKVMG